MGYTFKSLCIRNFKYITNNKPLKFDFMNSNIVILDGQNGYGKTTLFDAIEVLVTGKIKHFNPSLQNRKTETLGTLANDVNKDIVISAILSSDFSDEIHVERKLLCKNEFQSIITLKIKIKAEIITQIKTLLLNQKKEQSQLDDADKVLAQMTKARRGLIKEFYNAAESGKFDKNKCPLCGTDFTDIDSAIIKTEKFIKNIHTDGIKIIEDIETQITNLFQKEIIPVLKVFLEENKVLIKMDDTLSGCKDLAVEKLQQLLDKVKISEFKSQGIEKFDIGEFSQQYENLLKELQEKEVPNKIIFQEKQVELYKSIHNTYYHNEKPYHTVGELQSKEQYVAKLFNDNLSQQLSTEEARLRKLKRDYEEYKNKTKDMTDAIKVLVGKYEDANKEYQTQLLNAIKIPLMVYSGRIIQNYPLGLGIRAVIKTNQLVFEAASKSGSDVYNILSTGQLNGLSIALLLSIKNVYGDTKGLDILLIDDPLQTIDDISAISLADLLTQQGIGQIVLSTHEEAKAALLRYKFKHAGMSVREQNMQALYMKTVTEE